MKQVRCLRQAQPLESQQEKWHRLSKADAQQKELLQQELQKAHYEKMTFRPKIDRPADIVRLAPDSA